MAPKKKFRKQNSRESASVIRARARDWEARMKGTSVLRAVRIKTLSGSKRGTETKEAESLLRLRRNFRRKLDELVEEYTIELRRELRRSSSEE